MKKVAILQSNYLPWLGYFKMIQLVDEFIIYDDAQYTKNDWRNRNLIKTKYGVKWITIPIKKDNLTKKPINKVEVVNSNWIELHKNKIKESYLKAPYFEEVYKWLIKVFEECKDKKYLSEINVLFIKSICSILDIRTIITDCRNYQYTGDRNQKLIEILKGTNASIYLSGPAAKSYISKDLFLHNGIQVEWMKYDLNLSYSQIHGDFNLNVSIIDVFFNIGIDETKKMIEKLK